MASHEHRSEGRNTRKIKEYGRLRKEQKNPQDIPSTWTTEYTNIQEKKREIKDENCQIKVTLYRYKIR